MKNSAALLMGAIWLAPAQFTETESILPFTLTHRTVANPAVAAWSAAPSNPRGAGFCLGPDLDGYSYAPAGAVAAEGA